MGKVGDFWKDVFKIRIIWYLIGKNNDLLRKKLHDIIKFLREYSYQKVLSYFLSKKKEKHHESSIILKYNWDLIPNVL